MRYIFGQMENLNIGTSTSISIVLDGQRRAKKYRITVNEAYCKGCGYCIEFCPQKVFDRKKELNSKGVNPPEFARPDDCVGCGQCNSLCPDLAIRVEEVEDNE